MTTLAPGNTFASQYSGSIDALKGLLMLLVVMDHNDLIRAFVPELFKPLTFHVVGFLILPFLVPVKSLSQRQLFDRAVRYLVPFWFVLTLAAAIYTLLIRQDATVGTVAADWLAAAFIGSAPLVKTSAGFYYLWFLPALFGLVYVLSIFDAMKRSAQIVCALASLGCHAFITLVPLELHKYMPFGLLIVLWVLPFGMLMRLAVNSKIIYRARAVLIAVFVASYGALVARGQNIEVMTLELHPVTDPLLFILQDVSAFTGVLVAMWTAMHLKRIRFLNAMGRHSLMIYLFHPLIFFLGVKLIGIDNRELVSYPLAAAGIGSVALTAAAALALSILIAQVAFTRSWLTPKDWNGWGPVRLATHWIGRT